MTMAPFTARDTERGTKGVGKSMTAKAIWTGALKGKSYRLVLAPQPLGVGDPDLMIEWSSKDGLGVDAWIPVMDLETEVEVMKKALKAELK